MTYTKQEQKKHRQIWIEALRSGDYKQTQKRLKEDDGYCCLGVACDISGLGQWTNRCYDGGYKYSKRDYWSEVSYLPEEVMQYFGLTMKDGYARDKNGVGFTLLAMNDNNMSFDQIADIIESEPEGLLI